MASTNLEQMVKAPQTQQQQQQQQQHPQQHPQQQSVQKCPRCDSTNTKFCYYNNYSLAQPRHFCKACKRYWTRGGTLRNVPVGGGCRKKKRVKRPATITAEDHKYLSTPTTLSTKNSSSNVIFNVSPLLTHMHSNLSSFHSFSEYNSTRVGSGNTIVHGFDDTFDHPLGFSSGQLLMANGANTNSQTGLTNSCYASLANHFGPLSTSSGFASLLESDHGAQQKFTSGDNLVSDHNFVEFARHDENGMQQKVKMEQQMGLVDPNYSMFWSANGVGNYWLDSANICANSISSLI